MLDSWSSAREHVIVRVIAGSAKGRKLFAVPGDGTRPITDRVKEALFNILGADIEEATFLDLFAGTGSVGIEALSRGAAQTVFIEKAHKALDVVRRNLELTGLKARAEVVRADAFHYIKLVPEGTQFDYIYVAPPQYQELWADMLLALDERPSLLAPDGLIIVQIHPKEYRPVPLFNLTLARERNYGSTALHFYALNVSFSGQTEG